MGRCLCSVPWFGDNCEILGLEPKISPVSLQTVVEGATFHKVLTTSEVCPILRLMAQLYPIQPMAFH